MRGAGKTSLKQLILERRTRSALYHRPGYWDARAAAREGLSRSMWPSNVFNALWDERQRTLITRTLGDVTGRRLVDVGCGTGRMTRFLASLGAREVVGVDFSPATVSEAQRETDELAARARGARAVHLGAVSTRFAVGNVLENLEGVGLGDFDDAVVVGCLSVACRDESQLRTALGNVASLVRPGGRVLILEPIHRSPLLRRVLDLGVEEWIAAANGQGLALLSADRMGFAPLRLMLSVRDLPRPLAGPLFRGGERLLDVAPYLSSLADYKLLLFGRGPASAL